MELVKGDDYGKDIDVTSQNVSRTREARQILRRDIIEGRLRPNVHLVAADLAVELGISRTPVREALQLLANEGLVRTTSRGFVVREHTVEDIRQIYEVRAGLEGLAARLAADRATDDQIQAIEDVGCHRTDAVDWHRVIVDLNSSFHATVMEAAGNSVLAAVNKRNSEHFFNYRIAHLYSDEECAVSLDGHADILNNIRAGDGDGADAAARQHVIEALDVLLTKFRR